MKRLRNLRIMAMLLALVLIIGAAPVMAATEYDNLETIDFEAAPGYALSVSGRSIIITVPYTQTAGVELSSVITARAKATVTTAGNTYTVKLTSNGFESAESVAIGAGASVNVSYTLTDTENSSSVHTGTATYTVYVVKNSSFSKVEGTLPLRSGVVPSLTVNASQFGSDKATGKSCAYIELTAGAVPAYIDITAGPDSYSVGTGSKVKALSFTLNTAALSLLECNKPIDLGVKAYDENEQLIGEGLLSISVVSEATAIELIVGSDQTSILSPLDYLNAANDQITATAVMFTNVPTASQGVLTIDGVSVVSGARYIPGILAFAPAANYKGNVDIAYRGYDDSGYYFANTITCKVESYSGILIEKTAMVSGALQPPRNAVVTAADIKAACTASAFDLEHILLTSVPTTGVNAYIGTTAISSGQIWSDFTKELTLSPTEVGKHTITFSAMGGQRTYTGTIVLNATSGTFEDTYVYAEAANTRTDMSATVQSVIDKAKAAFEGDTLGAIQLSLLPYSVQGTLSSVYGVFYESESSSVPASSYALYTEETFKALSYCATEEAGTADLTYTIYDASGLYFVTGRICVSNKEYTPISYNATRNNPVIFSAADFDRAASEALGVGYTLTSIRLTSVSGPGGSLFCGSQSTPAITTAEYTRAQIDTLGFNPEKDFIGNAGVFYFAAKAANATGTAAEFAGSISITVTEHVDVFFQVSAGKSIAFTESAFESFITRYAAGKAQYMTFDDLPASGAIYEKYTSDEAVPAQSGKPYYFSSFKGLTGSEILVKNLIFAAGENPPANISVNIPFTVHGDDSFSRSGIIQIRVTKGDVSTMSGSAYCTCALMSADSIGKICTAATGSPLSHISFNLPEASAGRLYYNYKSATSYESKVSATDKFYAAASAAGAQISKVAFIPVAGFTGVCTIEYTAWATDGNWYCGTIRINVISKPSSGVFSDVSGSYKWAADSIDFLYSNGVTTGVTSTAYKPENNIKRGDFILMLYRAFDLSRYDAYAASTQNFDDVKSGDYYANAIRVARYLEIARGDGKSFSPESTITREEAMALIYRTLEKVNWSLSREVNTDYNSFKDADSVTSYAVDYMKYFVKTGVVVGSGGKLNPKAAISRAEMAVTLHRVLTY